MDPSAVPDFVVDLWRMVQAAGAFGGAMMFWLWKREADRADRLQTKIDEMNEKFMQSKDETNERMNKNLGDTALVLQGFKDLLQSGRGQ